MSEFLLATLGNLSNPANLLIEKASNALGRHFDPRQTVRMAEAEAKANQIRAISEAETEIQVAELHRRAAERFIYEELKKQSNMEEITRKAIPHLTDDAKPDSINDDWIANFFEKCRVISDDQMQELWAKILAGEGNNPGSFSRKTVNLMADIDKRDAELFTNLCRFIWIIEGSIEPLVFDVQLKIYNQWGINFDSISQLEALGLIHYSGLGNITLTNFPREISAFYGEKQVTLNFSNHDKNQLDIGGVILTQSGRELFRITEVKVVEDFFDYIYDRWANQSLLPPRHEYRGG